MDSPKRLSFLSYAVNGGGVGHVVRQVAIQRWLKRFCAFAGTRSEHWFLTTSEADTLCFHEGFSAFKLPSKTIVEEAGLDKLAYIAMAKQWVWNSLTLLRPDVLIVDTFPNGSFHELGNALDVVAKKALVLRPVKLPFARRGAFQALVQLYDRVIVPEHEDDEVSLLDELGLPSGRVAFTGPLVRSDHFDAFSAVEARRRLGIKDGQRAVLVTGGGGGDAGVAAFFDDVTAAVSAIAATTGEDIFIVYAAGALYRGAPLRGPSCTFFTGHDLAEHLAAFAPAPGVPAAVAVCAAGFNTIHEMLFAGVPTLVMPQQKIADDQHKRALRYADRKALRLTSPGALRGDLETLLHDDEARAATSAAARGQMPVNHAKDAAREILSLVFAPSILRAAEEALDDAFVGAVGDAGAAIGEVADLALALQGKGDRAALDGGAVNAALAVVTATQTPVPVLLRLIEQLKKKARVDDVAALAVTLLQAPSIAGQHGALLQLLQSMQPERSTNGADLVAALVDAADRTAGRGQALATLAATLPLVGVAGGNSLNVARLRAAAQQPGTA